MAETNADAARGAELIIVCIPVGVCGEVAKEIGPHLKSGATVSDVGSVKGAIVQPGFSIDSSGQTTVQKNARDQLDQILALLNSKAGDRYLFSGTGVNQPATDTTAHILDGNGARAGLRQVVTERTGSPGQATRWPASSSQSSRYQQMTGATAAR